MNRTWTWTNTTFTPEINIAWQREYEDRNRHFGIALFGLSNRILIAEPGRNTALGGIDLLWTFFDKYGVEASYDFEWNTHYMDHFFYLGCSFRF